MKRKAIAIFLTVVILVLICIILTQNTSDRILLNIVGLVPSAQKVCHVHLKNIDDSRTVELWAVLSMNMKQADDYMADLKATRTAENNGFEIPYPKKKVSWWLPPDNTASGAQIHWMRVDTGGSSRRPAILSAVWHKEKLFIYYYGMPQQMLMIRTDKPTSPE